MISNKMITSNGRVIVTLAGIVMAVICLICFQSFQSDISSFTSSNQGYINNRRLLERELPKRTIQERSLIPAAVKLSSAEEVSPPISLSTTSVKSDSWSFTSWFKPSKANPIDTTKDIRQNSNFIDEKKKVHEQPESAVVTTTTSTSSSAYSKFDLNKDQCRNEYGERKFLTVSEQKFPPMLYTFPGSGNTWCRLLIEYATGIYTGSVYNDKSLLHALPGEFTCNKQVSVIKIHPHTHTFESLRTGRFQSDARKCQRGGIDKIRRAILLIRDPFDSIWSEFQRRITQSHVGGIQKSNFNWPRWQANAASLSHQYNIMWAIHHTGIEKHFSKENILYIKYEDLKNKSTRVDTMQRVVDFLGIASPSREQLECSFLLADNRETHRLVDKSMVMSKMEAYTIPLVCRMWALFGKYAVKHGYGVYNNIDCSVLAPGTDANPIAKGQGGAVVAVPGGNSSTNNVYPPIPRVNVGGQGEYDRKWVKTGQFLLDFGGHPTAQPAATPAPGHNKRLWRNPGSGNKVNNNKNKVLRPRKPGFIENTVTTTSTTAITGSSGDNVVQNDLQNKAVLQAALTGHVGQETHTQLLPTTTTHTTTSANVLQQLLTEPLATTTTTTDTSTNSNTNPNSNKRRNRRNRFGNPLPSIPPQHSSSGAAAGISTPALEAATVGIASPITPKLITANSIDIGGRDKADMSNWLTQKLPPPTDTTTDSSKGMHQINNLRSRKFNKKKNNIRRGERLDTTTTTSTNEGGSMEGMDMNTASQKDTVIGTVGADKPAWQ